MLEFALLLFFPFFMAYAASSDLVSMTISNNISLALMGGFCAMAYWVEMDLTQFGWHWAMFVIALLIGFGLFAAGIVGGGDAKLLASTALWLGWEHTFQYVLIFSILGGVLTLVLLRLRSVPLPERVENVDWIARLYRADTGIPYGIAMGIAALLVYPSTPWMEHVYQVARAL